MRLGRSATNLIATNPIASNPIDEPRELPFDQFRAVQLYVLRAALAMILRLRVEAELERSRSYLLCTSAPGAGCLDIPESAICRARKIAKPCKACMPVRIALYRATTLQMK
jgi:hypothetical protein